MPFGGLLIHHQAAFGRFGGACRVLQMMGELAQNLKSSIHLFVGLAL
jgi:hypothetical protein